MTRLLTLALVVALAPAAAQQRPPRPPAPKPPAPMPQVMPDRWLDFELADLELQLADAAALAFDLKDRWLVELEMDTASDALAEARLMLEDDARWLLDERLDMAFDALIDEPMIHMELADHALLASEMDLARATVEGAMLALPDWPGGGVLVDTPLRGSLPRAPWAAGDQADSLYRSARQALTRGDYQRAAEWFRLIPERYPESAYAPDALYWEAFARYRMGATAELRAALVALERQRARYAEAATRADAAALATRIRGALAARGDREAAAQLEREAAQSGATCDKEETAVRVEALNALVAMDPNASTDLIARVLARRDECTAPLRRRAVFLLGRRADSTAATLLIDVARNDPDPDVRGYAIRWLGRAPGERALATLEGLAASSDERVQRDAVRALAAHSSPRARALLRRVIENANASEQLRSDAIAAFGEETTGAEDAAWLRAVYARLTSPRLKGRVISSVSRLEGAENAQWLLGIARSESEPVDLRAAAVSAAGRKDGVAIDDLVRLWDVMSERRLRERLIAAYGRRDEPQATDQLITIVRTGTDPQLRRSAISALSRKKDPRTARLLMELIDQ